MANDIPEKRYHFELLTAQLDVSAFDCGYVILNDFLRTEALSETQRDLSRTYVLLDLDASPQETMVGYFTLRADSFTFTPPNQRGAVILPVVELVYLARHVGAYGQRIGDTLLIEALHHVNEAANWIGIAGMHLTPTQEGRRLYARHGFHEHPYGDWWLFLPIGAIRTIVNGTDGAS